MTPLLRWFRFNLVGALGMGVQLASLAVFNRVMPGHYLLATAAAIELTLLHNFWWHLRFTWPASRDRASRLRALMRFQLTSGLISLTGNLVLMRLFVGLLHFPVLAANLLAILCCSLANFALSDGWSFAGPPAPSLEAPALPMRELAILLLLSFPAAPGHAQSSPNAPVPAIPANASYVTNAGIFCGGGSSTSPVATRPTVGCGAGLKILPGILFAEVGVMGPQANRSSLSGYVSLDTSVPLAPVRAKYLPLILLGYSRLFETGHALDYGLALAMPRIGKHDEDGGSLRLELRDYWTFANPTQHNVMLRVGWMIPSTD